MPGSAHLSPERPIIIHSKKKRGTCLNAPSSWEKPETRLVVVCTLLRWENQVGVNLHEALENFFLNIYRRDSFPKEV